MAVPRCCGSRSVDPGEPGPGQVRIRNTAVAVNYRDVLIRRGVHAVASLSVRHRPRKRWRDRGGGARGHGFSVGDRVAYAGRPEGSYAHVRIVPAARLIALPDRIDERTAAAMMIRGMTARALLHETYKVQARRPDPHPCRRRRGRPDHVPMGQASRRHRDRHREQRREGRHCSRPRLRSCDRLYAGGFLRTRPRDHRRRRRSRGLRLRGQGDLRGLAALPAPARRDGVLRRSLGRSRSGCRRDGSARSARSISPIPAFPTTPSPAPTCSRRQTICSQWWRAARSRSRSARPIRLQDAPRAHADLEATQDHRLDCSGRLRPLLVSSPRKRGPSIHS